MCADGNKNSTVDKNTNIQKLCATTEDFFYAQRPCIVSVATVRKKKYSATENSVEKLSQLILYSQAYINT